MCGMVVRDADRDRTDDVEGGIDHDHGRPYDIGTRISGICSVANLHPSARGIASDRGCCYICVCHRVLYGSCHTDHNLVYFDPVSPICGSSDSCMVQYYTAFIVATALFSKTQFTDSALIHTYMLSLVLL